MECLNLLSRLAANGLIATRGMQQEHIHWELKLGQSLHRWQQVDDWEHFSKKKAARARAQGLRALGKMTWREKEEKWWSHKTMHKKWYGYINY